MPIDVDTALAPDVLILRLRVKWPTIDEQRTTRATLIGNGQLTETTRALIDLREVITPHHDEARAIVSAASEDGGWPLRRAYLVGSAVQFGFSRQLQSLSANTHQIEIFTSEQDAMMWLYRTGLSRREEPPALRGASRATPR